MSSIISQSYTPQLSQSPVPSDSSIQSTNREPTQTPLLAPTQVPRSEPKISGEWEGKYTCSQGVTGVTIAIDQTGNKVIAELSLYPVAENPNIPRGLAKYEGNFNSISRRMIFPEGTWLNNPGLFWTAFGFQGQFDENLEIFSGKMDHRSCTIFNLRRKRN